MKAKLNLHKAVDLLFDLDYVGLNIMVTSVDIQKAYHNHSPSYQIFEM